MLLPQTYVEGGENYELLLLGEMTPFGVLLALGGLYALARREGAIATALVFAVAIPSAFSIAYTIETDPQRYDLIPFAVIAAFAGIGASEIARALPPLRNASLVTTGVLAIGLLIYNGGTFEQRDADGARAVITTVVEKTPRNAVLIAPWLYATPLAYGAYVEHKLDRRIIISAWLSEDAKRVPRWTADAAGVRGGSSVRASSGVPAREDSGRRSALSRNALIAGAAAFVVTLLVSHFDRLHITITFFSPTRCSRPCLDQLAGRIHRCVSLRGQHYVIEAPLPAILLIPYVAFFGAAANQTLLAVLLAGLPSAPHGSSASASPTAPATSGSARSCLAGTDLLWCAMLGDVWFIAHVSASASRCLALVESSGKRRGWLVALWAVCAAESRFTLRWRCRSTLMLRARPERGAHAR